MRACHDFTSPEFIGHANSECDAAPLSGRARRIPVEGRARKRGPRSCIAHLRRKCKIHRAPPGAASGSSDACAPGIVLSSEIISEPRIIKPNSDSMHLSV